MELRVEVANAASLRGRFAAAVAHGRISGWRCVHDRLVTIVAGTEITFEVILDVRPARAPHIAACEVVVYRASGSEDPDTLNDAITRLEVTLRNKFVTPPPDADPIDDFGVVNAEFVIRE